MGDTDATRRRSRGAGMIVLVALAATACVGSIDRDEFEELVDERGGGLSQTLVIDAVDALEAELETDALMVRSLTATNETVTIEAVNPDLPDELDRWVYRGGDLDGPEPVDQGTTTFSIPDLSIPDLPEGIELPPEVQDLIDQGGGATTVTGGAGVFALDTVALDRLNAVVDGAIEAAGLRGGYADSLTIATVADAGPQIRVQVTNDRQTVTATFDGAGQPTGADG